MPVYILVFHLAILLVTHNAAVFVRSSEDHRAALFIFGDSFSDSGNNNYINTTLRANFWPYGETFFRCPTGRTSDGRLIPDFIAEYANLRFLPLYKEPGNHKLTSGVNFASAGAGVLVETYPGLVIDLETQLGYFKNVANLLKQRIGEKEAEKILSRAVYFFNIGTNDYTYPFLTNSSLFESHSNQEFVEMVVKNLTYVFKEIYKIGGRKFASVNLGPLGCFPFMKVLVKPPTGECLEEVNSLVKLHNTAFAQVLKMLEIQLDGFKYSNFDFYTSITQRMNNPSKYGFKDGKSACCGSGPYRGLITCGGKGGAKKYELCSKAGDYLFFDSVHPSDVANQQFAEMMWTGTSETVVPRPYNLESLFHQI